MTPIEELKRVLAQNRDISRRTGLSGSADIFAAQLAAIEQLEACCKELEQDKARLDWLEDNGALLEFYYRDDPFGNATVETWRCTRYEGQSLPSDERSTARAAIDAAKEGGR